jgi:hypothetical protein
MDWESVCSTTHVDEMLLFERKWRALLENLAVFQQFGVVCAGTLKVIAGTCES